MTAIPVVAWERFVPRWRWRQGEHVAMVGPTGQGKTTMALQLIPRRRHHVIISTKARDDTLRLLTRHEGYQLVRDWPPRVPTDKVILWPPYRRSQDVARQRAVIGHALEDIVGAGSWGVLADDVQYMHDVLGLGRLLRMHWYQARSMGVSLMAATQRPRRVPVEMWSQSTHAFIWRTNASDLKDVAELGAADPRTIRAAVAELPPHHALYVDARRGTMLVTQAPKRGGARHAA